MLNRRLILTALIVLMGNLSLTANEPATAFQAFVIEQARQLRSDDRPAKSIDEWNVRRETLRQNLIKAWGGFPSTDCELEPRKLGEFKRPGYRVEKVTFQTRPGVLMTANAYVPDKPGKLPAILHVHGHWEGAKQDPVVQSRCIGCAKLGFFVLCVDAFGAGERGIKKKLGEYHGEMTGATLFPIGLPLSGLQVYENKRAVDYLISRPEVDPTRIGITGASGGGNQTMYAGAIDERIRCVVPTCSVGTYQSYLSAACCLCEVVPGALTFTEEGDVLALAANRGLMVTSATQDAFQFSVGEATKSMARIQSVSRLFSEEGVRHTIIESPHAYNRPMREAMYGWMTRHLKREGDGSPIEDPQIQPEDPELLRCFPGETRPENFVTIPRFAAAEADRLAGLRTVPQSRDEWEKSLRERRRMLVECLGGRPKSSSLQLAAVDDVSGTNQTLTFDSEPKLQLVASRDLPERSGRIAIIIDLDGGAERAFSGDLAKSLRDGGWSVVAPELRATGRFADPRDKIHHAPDHNTAEWSLWIGRPLLGQWTYDISRTLDAIAEREGSLPHDILAIGQGSSGVVALCATALDERITRVKLIDSLVSYATDQPYRQQRLGLMVPGILRDVGDIADLASLVAPRAVTIQGGKTGSGTELDRDAIATRFTRPKRVFELLGVPGLLVIETAR